MPKKISHEEYLRKLKDVWGDEFSIIEEYSNAKNKIEVRHAVCDKIFKTLPFSLLSGHSCPFCADIKRANKKSFTPKEFEKRIFEIVGNEYSVIED